MIRYPLEYNQILNGLRWNTFGWTRTYKDGRPRFHKGWDLQQPKGTPVYPVSTGKVFSVQRHDVGKYGKTINFRFEHNGTVYYAFYGHLSEVWVSAGDIIDTTNVHIGAVGDTGNAKGIAKDAVHLHFEFRSDAYGGNGTSDRVDPVKLLGDPPYDGIFYIEDE